MQKAIIDRKIGMAQIFDEKRSVVLVAAVEAGSCVVSQKKTVENDDYVAVQVGSGDRKLNCLNEPLKGCFAKVNVAPERTLRGSGLSNTDAYSVGDLIKADVFKKGDKVNVSGISKGKGYADAIKCWNFQRLKETHGISPVAGHRGSLGVSSSPSKVFKGLKATGHIGIEKVTVRNLTVVEVDIEDSLIVTKGAIPGPNDGVIIIRDSVKA